MTDDENVCGVKTADGTPCQNPANENGHCWIEAHGGDVEPGRDSKLTKERQEAIAGAIEQGASISEAARKNGIHRETFYRWMSKGEEQEEGPYADFHDRLTRARGQGEASYRTALMQIAIENNDTATLMAMLKQRYPDEWGDVDRGQQSGGVEVFLEAPETIELDEQQ
jgi:transposase-like protein